MNTTASMKHYKHTQNTRVVIMPALSLLHCMQGIVMTTHEAISDDKVGNSFLWTQ